MQGLLQLSTTEIGIYKSQSKFINLYLNRYDTVAQPLTVYTTVVGSGSNNKTRCGIVLRHSTRNVLKFDSN